MKRLLYLAMTLGACIYMTTPTLANSKMTILVWGDSLSAAYGMPITKGWVHLLQQTLGNTVHIVNGSISGETTTGGLTRLPKALTQHKPHYMILELGANDGLRGQSIQKMKQNLQQMITLAQAAKTKVLLVGMKLPPNYGQRYIQQFETAYRQLAQENQLAFVPFILDGVAQDFDLMQMDGIHPTIKAQPKVLNNVLPTLQKFLLKTPHANYDSSQT